MCLCVSTVSVGDVVCVVPIDALWGGGVASVFVFYGAMWQSVSLCGNNSL